MKMNTAVISVVIPLLMLLSGCQGDSCPRGEQGRTRYLLYDVNSGEGFNLRRDVYVRVANLIRTLSQDHDWVLVLPPWGRLYHWFSTPRGTYFPWRSFFDVPSLQKWIKVIEFEEFSKAHGPRVDAAYVLQHYEEGWTDGKWDEKYDERPCLGRAAFQYQEGEGVWLGAMWGSQLTSQTFSCVSVQGRASSIIPLLTKDASSSRSIYIGRAETLLHDEYGGEWYWRARRSMRFAVHLYDEAARYRAEHLASSDGQDGTPVTPDWRDTRPQRKRGKGGPYIAVHLRRNDFVQARGEEVPSLGKAAEQIKELLRQQNLTSVFIATDAPQEEFLELDRLLASAAVHQYVPPPPFQQRWGDGGVAIVDQIICAHARYFVGSYESTFSFRIQEEREILGFAEETTFNRLCGAGVRCEQPAKWKITY